VALEETIKTGAAADDESYLRDFISDENAIDPSESLESEEAKKMLIKAVQELPEKERKVIILYYYSGLTLKEIGELLGVSESRASQIHSKAISMLKSMLK
jgi:RNA polymerase sigma factor for flagellar operon FliA